MKGQSNIFLLFIMVCVIFVGCVRDEDFIALQADVTVMENHIQRIQGKTIKETKQKISTLSESQRSQSGTLDQSLRRLSLLEQSLNSVELDQEKINVRLDRREKGHRTQSELMDTLSKDTKANMKKSITQLSSDFNSAQKELASNVTKQIKGQTKSLETRIKNLENEVENFYRVLDQTLESYSGEGYIVKSGDTLSKIAANLGLSMKALAEANGIKDPSKIKIGQKLIIPE